MAESSRLVLDLPLAWPEAAPGNKCNNSGVGASQLGQAQPLACWSSAFLTQYLGVMFVKQPLLARARGRIHRHWVQITTPRILLSPEPAVLVAQGLFHISITCSRTIPATTSPWTTYDNMHLEVVPASQFSPALGWKSWYFALLPEIWADTTSKPRGLTAWSVCKDPESLSLPGPQHHPTARMTLAIAGGHVLGFMWLLDTHMARQLVYGTTSSAQSLC